MRISKLFFLLTALLLSFELFAGHVTPNRAETVARNAYLERSNLEGTSLNAGEINITSVVADYNGSNVNYYVANIENRGFIIIAGDDVVTPILGYSFENNFSAQDLPPQLEALLGEYKKEMEDVFSSDNINAPADVSSDWAKYESTVVNSTELEAVAPLIESNWAQGCGFNNYCPADGQGPCSKALVGCVAVAMGQVLYYHKQPITGNGSHSYSHPKYGTLSANFGNTTYQWSSMSNSSGTNAASLLLYHCGVSVDMDYGPGASGIPVSALNRVSNAFINYFKYSNDAVIRHKSSYSAVAWDNMVKAELNANRPLFYVGIGTGGHAFNVDGYQGTNHFHVNWGWSGSYNGYYYLSSLSPGGYDFSNSQAAAFNVEPKESCTPNITITTAINGGTHDFRASNTITATNKISGGATVHYGAGQRVMLKNGFRVYAGCAFSADLSGCANTKSATESPNIIEKMDEEFDIQISNTFEVYPNPSYGDLMVKLSSDNSSKIVSVYSMHGKLIKQIETDQDQVQLDLGGNNPGIYLIKVNQNGNYQTGKLILK